MTTELKYTPPVFYASAERLLGGGEDGLWHGISRPPIASDVHMDSTIRSGVHLNGSMRASARLRESKSSAVGPTMFDASNEMSISDFDV